MQNGVLFTRNIKNYIDLLFQNIDEIQQAIQEAQEDPDSAKVVMAGTNLIRKPTETAVLRKAKQVKIVYIKTKDGALIKIESPSLWLLLFRRCCRLYVHSDVWRIIKDRYRDNKKQNLSKPERQQLERFLSDCFIMAVQLRLLKVEV